MKKTICIRLTLLCVFISIVPKASAQASDDIVGSWKLDYKATMALMPDEEKRIFNAEDAKVFKYYSSVTVYRFIGLKRTESMNCTGKIIK